MGGLWRAMPVTALTFTAAALSMAGIPPLSGFWSKEEILGALAGFGQPFLIWGLSIAFLTAFYAARAVILTFAGPSRDPHAHPHESPLVMTGPLMILMAGAVGIGFMGTVPFGGHWFQHFLGAAAERSGAGTVPFGGHWFQHFLGAAAERSGAGTVPFGDSPFGPGWIQPAAIGVALSGIGLAILRYGFGWALLPAGARALGRPLYRLAANKYYVDEIYDRLIIQPALAVSRRCFSFDAGVIDGAVNRTGAFGLSLSGFKGWVDQTIVDGLVNATATVCGRTGAALRLLQTGLVQNYLLIAAGGAITLFCILRWIF